MSTAQKLCKKRLSRLLSLLRKKIHIQSKPNGKNYDPVKGKFDHVSSTQSCFYLNVRVRRTKVNNSDLNGLGSNSFVFMFSVK